ncbi:Gmad2 immunoglobulin-like domain-containing protein [Paenibacillus sp. HB172176]|uniref:Gmad2 immunoglobulin-like domain-containing protein n=1 Tax=Paenibacillus sp. HB172176 TaxID=2493690 RepID=UPI00143A773E|nr:Gmad2 immunoglobulin-like domain-containing protein [Paenibacillus sp. HB172176]
MKKHKGFLIGLLAGCLLMMAAPAMASTLKSYMLSDTTYPIKVNGAAYEQEELPMMNYNGHTYVPLKAVGDLLNAGVDWNEEEHSVEIGNAKERAFCNEAYCNVTISGSGGQYLVTGEGRVFEGVVNYAVSDGSNYLLEGIKQLDEGAPEWSDFTIAVAIPANQLPANGTLTLELFEESANDGSRIHELIVPMETFGP